MSPAPARASARSRFKILLLAGVCILGAAGAPAVRAQEDALVSAFKAPPISVRPWVRWWWPGGAVDDAELRREVGALDQAGFGGGEIQPFNPGIADLSPQERAKVDDYATPSFFAHLAAATDEAHARGLRLDYTFGSAWPSGGGYAITPELALVELTASLTTVRGGQSGPIRLTPPPRTRKLGGAMPSLDPRNRAADAADWPARIDARQKIVAVVALKGSAPSLQAPASGGFKLHPWARVLAPGQLQSGTAVALTSRLRPDGVLDWTPPPGEWQVLVFKQYVADAAVSAGVGAGPQLVLDHFKRAAFDAHARRVGDAAVPQLGKAFGGPLRATFVDSLELMPDLYWSEDMLAQFKRRRGYDLTPYLPLLIQPGWMQTWGAYWSRPYYEMPGGPGGELGARVREDYRRTLSELITENFYGPFVKWNHAHGLLARLQAHGAPSDTLKTYGLADIPETEDLEGGGDIDFMKLARAAGDIYGRREISGESWCWPGRPYSVTPEDFKRRSDLMFLSGVNRLVVHGFPYALHADKWPGWHAFPPTFGPGFSTMLSETNPLWAVTPTLTAYVARAQAVLQAGDNVVPVAIFMQDAVSYSGHETKGRGEPPLFKRLVDAGYDYDRINTDGLARSKLVGGELVTPGGHAFSVVVVPKSEVIDLQAAELLARFAKAGLKVVFIDALPTRSEGLKDAARRDARVRAAVSGGRVVAEPELPGQLRAAGVPANLVFDPGSETAFVEKAAGERRIYFLRNDGASERTIGFIAPMASGGAQLWDAWTGTVAPLGVEARPGGRHVQVPLKPGASAFVVFAPDLPQVAAVAPKALVTLTAQPLPDRWTLAAEGHGADGRRIVERREGVALADLREVPGLADFSGAVRYSQTVEIAREWLSAGRRVRLDLGAAYDAAIVTVNGQRLPPLVIRPFEADITAALRPGENRLQIEVVNTPQNAMAASRGPAAKSLRSQAAGLVGPVRIESLEPAA